MSKETKVTMNKLESESETLEEEKVLQESERGFENLKTTVRSNDDKHEITTRINRIIGSLGGINKMIEENRYCHDILIQLSAIDKSIKSLANRIIEKHLKSCVVQSIKDGNEDVMSEVVELFKRFQ